jgi:hypothetical protein
MKNKLFFILAMARLNSFAVNVDWRDQVEYYQGKTTCAWALEVKTLSDTNVFAAFTYNGLKYMAYFNPSDSRCVRSIVTLVDAPMTSVINRPFTEEEEMGLSLATGFVLSIYRKIFGLSQLYIAGNNSHDFNKASGKTMLGKPNEPNMLHAHIIARGNPDLVIGDGVLAGPPPGYMFDMRGQTIGEKGNEKKEKWSSLKMRDIKTRVQQEIQTRIEEGRTWGIDIEMAQDYYPEDKVLECRGEKHKYVTTHAYKLRQERFVNGKPKIEKLVSSF